MRAGSRQRNGAREREQHAGNRPRPPRRLALDREPTLEFASEVDIETVPVIVQVACQPGGRLTLTPFHYRIEQPPQQRTVMRGRRDIQGCRRRIGRIDRHGYLSCGSRGPWAFSSVTLFWARYRTPW